MTPDPSLNGQAEDDTREVFPALVPAQWRVGQVVLTNSEGEDPVLCVVMEVRTPTGIHVTFWPDDSAVRLGEELIKFGGPTAEGRNIAAEEQQEPF